MKKRKGKAAKKAMKFEERKLKAEKWVADMMVNFMVGI